MKPIETRSGGNEAYRGIGRPLVVAVLGQASLADKARDVGIRVSLFDTEASFRAADAAIDAQSFDAVVVAFEPWPKVDGVALARGLRRRCVGTVVVGESGHHFLLEEMLAVVPPSATAEVRRWDLQTAIAVAAQETWAIAPMRDPWAEGSTWPGERTTEEHVVGPQAAPVEASWPSPSISPSQIRQDELGRASHSTMVQLFGDEDLTALQAPPLPPAASQSPVPQWAAGGTREWAPSGSVLAELSEGAYDSSGPARAGPPPPPPRSEFEISVEPVVSSSSGFGDGAGPRPPAVSQRTLETPRATLPARTSAWSTRLVGYLLLGVAVGFAVMAIRFR